MSLWDQEEYESLRPHRGRPLAELEKRIGNITGQIQDLISEGKHPRILEVGHGFGSVLVQLLERFGSDIELHAISVEDYWGSRDVIQRNALLMNLATEADLATLKQLSIHVADLNLGLPFPSEYFDFIYSQVSFFMFREKLFFLQECCRALAHGGLALIDVHPMILPNMAQELATLLDIRAGEELIDFWTFIEKFPWLSRKRALLRDYLEVRKCDNPKLNVSLRAAVNLGDLRDDWYGTKSIYDINPE